VRGGKLVALTIFALLSICFALPPVSAQVSTTPSPSPTDSPTPTSTPSPTGSPSPSPTIAPSDSPSPSPTDPTPSAPAGGGHKDGWRGGGLIAASESDRRADRIRAADRGHHPRRHHDVSWNPDPRWGDYSTTGLVQVAGKLASRGRRPGAIDARVFAPFPVAGLAAWTDTWGAPRYAGGYHPHHGQDLMCEEGTPLLAVQDGTIQLNSDPLGGVSLFLVRSNGSFWYYAHLSRYANGITEGTQVRTGQRIGRCGSTGDATVSHLHFAHYSTSGVARDPMGHLVRWLHTAERSAGLRPSTGRGVHLPKSFTHQVGNEPAQPVSGAAVRSSSPVVPPTLAPPSQLVVTGPSYPSVGFLVGATLLLLPVPLASKRVRAEVVRLRRVSRSP